MRPLHFFSKRLSGKDCSARHAESTALWRKRAASRRMGDGLRRICAAWRLIGDGLRRMRAANAAHGGGWSAARSHTVAEALSPRDAPFAIIVVPIKGETAIGRRIPPCAISASGAESAQGSLLTPIRTCARCASASLRMAFAGARTAARTSARKPAASPQRPSAHAHVRKRPACRPNRKPMPGTRLQRQA